MNPLFYKFSVKLWDGCDNYLICGHTHRRVIGEVVPGFMGVNVGSDYDDLKIFVLEV